MEIKKVLNLLTNQYYKSFKRFEKYYSFSSNFNEKVKRFNEGYLKLTSAVLNSSSADKIRANLHNSLVYAWATDNERVKLDEELYWNILTLTRTNTRI